MHRRFVVPLALLIAACASPGDIEMEGSLAPAVATTADEQATTSAAPTTTSTRAETTTTQPTTTTTTVGDPTTTVTTVRSTTTTRPVTTTSPTTTTRPAVQFRSSISSVTAADLYASWRPGCPLDVSQLRAVDVTHWGYDGEAHTGRLVVAADVAAGIVAIMEDLFDAGFPIQRMRPVDVYDGDDDKSMAANNTSAFNCRAVTGGSSWSEHSYGRAIDVNPLVNPYVRGGTVLPPEGKRFADRSLDEPGMIHSGDEVVQAFAARGWIWGGTWSSPKDYQHFSTTGR